MTVTRAGLSALLVALRLHKPAHHHQSMTSMPKSGLHIMAWMACTLGMPCIGSVSNLLAIWQSLSLLSTALLAWRAGEVPQFIVQMVNHCRSVPPGAVPNYAYLHDIIDRTYASGPYAAAAGKPHLATGPGPRAAIMATEE
jgi:hypothetical protein